jgi:hypothetical protein
MGKPGGHATHRVLAADHRRLAGRQHDQPNLLAIEQIAKLLGGDIIGASVPVLEEQIALLGAGALVVSKQVPPAAWARQGIVLGPLRHPPIGVVRAVAIKMQHIDGRQILGLQPPDQLVDGCGPEELDAHPPRRVRLQRVHHRLRIARGSRKPLSSGRLTANTRCKWFLAFG